MDRLSGHKLAAHRNPFRAFNGRKKQAWSWQSQLGFFVGEVKVLFWGFGLSVFDLVLWFRAIWIPIGYEPL